VVQQRATINDVAALAGVSIKTVSRVLNHEPRVRAATLGRVEAAIRTLNYRPNSSARMLAGKRCYLVGLIYNANSSYITSIQNGVLEACKDKHYDLLIHPCRYAEPGFLKELSDLITAPKVDGLLLTPPIADIADVQELMRRLETPNVVISHGSTTGPEWTVCTNDREVCAETVAHLAALGHRRIAFLRGHPDHKAVASRYDGFVDGMKTAGIDVSAALVVQGDNGFQSGVDGAKTLLRRKERPTAIFCANDHMAAGAMKVAHDIGLSIPGDLSVAGFDDIPLAKQIWPQLTTVRQPLHTMARLAGEILIQRLHGTPPAGRHQVVASELVIRDSTGPAPTGVYRLRSPDWNVADTDPPCA
jgi:LacI family transcriptional regulator